MCAQRDKSGVFGPMRARQMCRKIVLKGMAAHQNTSRLRQIYVKVKWKLKRDVTEDEDSAQKPVSDHDINLFRTIFYVSKEELPADKVNSLFELQNLNGANIKCKNLSYITINEIQD